MRQEEEIKGMEIGREERKPSLFAGNIIVYTENHKQSTHTHAHNLRTNVFSKVTEYKVNTQKSIIFLYTNNEHLETEIKTIPFIKMSNKIKYLDINLTKHI